MDKLPSTWKEYKDHYLPKYPKGVWVAGVVGAISGVFFFSEPLSGLTFGLSCLLIANGIYGLLRGEIAWAAGNVWTPSGISTLRDEPMSYWLMVLVHLLVGGLVAFFVF